jgi:hypothetical protein
MIGLTIRFEDEAKMFPALMRQAQPEEIEMPSDWTVRLIVSALEGAATNLRRDFGLGPRSVRLGAASREPDEEADAALAAKREAFTTAAALVQKKADYYERQMNAATGDREEWGRRKYAGRLSAASALVGEIRDLRLEDSRRADETGPGPCLD